MINRINLLIDNRPLYNRMKIFSIATSKYKHLFKKVWGVFYRYPKDLFKCNKRGFIGYQEYKKKVAFLDEFSYYNNKTNNKRIITGVLIALCLITPFTNWAIPYIIIKARKGGF